MLGGLNAGIGLLVVVVMAACAAGCAAPRSTPARSPHAGMAPRDAIEIVHQSDDEDTIVMTLLGIDEAARVAYVERSVRVPGREAPGTVVDTIDLVTGTRSVSWQVGSAGSYADTRQRYALIARRVGAFAAYELTTMRMFSTPDGAAILDTGADRVFRAAASGEGDDDAFPGLKASFAPLFAPDGRTIVLRGYEKGRGPPGRFGLEQGALYVGELGRTPRRIDDVLDPGWLAFDPEGRLYALAGRHIGAADKRRTRWCATRVDDVALSPAVTELSCQESPQLAALLIAPGRRLAALLVPDEDDGRFRVHLLELPSGRVLSTRALRGPVGSTHTPPHGIMDDHGRIALPESGTLWLIDARSGQTAAIKAGPSDIFGARMLGDGRFGAVRERPGEGPEPRTVHELILIDLARALGGTDTRPR